MNQREINMGFAQYAHDNLIFICNERVAIIIMQLR